MRSEKRRSDLAMTPMMKKMGTFHFGTGFTLAQDYFGADYLGANYFGKDYFGAGLSWHELSWRRLLWRGLPWRKLFGAD